MRRFLLSLVLLVGFTSVALAEDKVSNAVLIKRTINLDVTNECKEMIVFAGYAECRFQLQIGTDEFVLGTSGNILTLNGFKSRLTSTEHYDHVAFAIYPPENKYPAKEEYYAMALAFQNAFNLKTYTVTLLGGEK
ncbi:MAG: hypothetical protein A3F16_01080 [Deltaproteobacteria bacterium RIFCSPHIGHO2_12_FULL_43_9]|nr:MAG: hypothetical protein A3F16_01080 [Deltaproteobacteria bacterium RIFCSPHIGHO2_12_FULL_43_9]